MNKLLKFATCCLIGTIAFAGKTGVAQADEIKMDDAPVAGIDLVLGDIYQNTNYNIDISEFLPSEFDDLAFAQVSSYVNIRNKAGEDGDILGKLYNNSAATILKEGNGWTKVKSGTVTGYIKSEFLATGDKAEKIAGTVGTKLATVNTTTLKVRDKADTDSQVITLVPIGEELRVLKEADGWLKVSVGGNDTGYVSSDYVNESMEYEEAVSIIEEQERLEAEEEARNDSTPKPTVQPSKSSTSNSSVKQNPVRRPSGNTSSSNAAKPSNSSIPNNSSLRSRVVSYALRFVGNPYVWGGTSLTNGTDCSGFTQSVLGDNGISISRTSRTQAVGGRTVSIGSVQPGDLVFYERYGTINHVAMYIGNGQVVSASSPETGIRITGLYYRQPCKAVSYIN